MSPWPSQTLKSRLHRRPAGVTPGTLVWVWSVVVGNSIFVRSANPHSRWFAAAMRERAGIVRTADYEGPATFTPVTDEELKNRIDAACTDKYAHARCFSPAVLEKSRQQIDGISPARTGRTDAGTPTTQPTSPRTPILTGRGLRATGRRLSPALSRRRTHEPRSATTAMTHTAPRTSPHHPPLRHPRHRMTQTTTRQRQQHHTTAPPRHTRKQAGAETAADDAACCHPRHRMTQTTTRQRQQHHTTAPPRHTRKQAGAETAADDAAAAGARRRARTRDARGEPHRDRPPSSSLLQAELPGRRVSLRRDAAQAAARRRDAADGSGPPMPIQELDASAQPPSPEWGLLLAENQPYIERAPGPSSPSSAFWPSPRPAEHASPGAAGSNRPQPYGPPGPSRPGTPSSPPCPPPPAFPNGGDAGRADECRAGGVAPVVAAARVYSYRVTPRAASASSTGSVPPSSSISYIW
ncbi:hypothetical protein SUDANB145_07345 (plasmid) [Streptomyces sp. enrichment culture]